MTSSLSSQPSSQSLIRRVRNNDRVAWDRLCILYGPVVYEWAREAGLQSEDASDVMQEVFAVLTRRIASYQAHHSFRGWLWTITRNKVVDAYRRRADHDVSAGGTAAFDRLMNLPANPPAEDSEVGKREASGIHQRALDVMKTDFEPQTWQAFWRTVVGDENPADVATDLGVSKWTVYKAKSRVLQRLRDEFSDLI